MEEEYTTEILSAGTADILLAAEYIKKGKLVAFPTETVYGLGGDALNPESSKKIYKAKGRPSDNPLIVHLSDFSEAEKYVLDIPSAAKRLMDIFSPGPITIVLPKKDIIPFETSGGLDTVGIRVPVNDVARKFIESCKTPIAAPSANLSGRPSPTSAMHVYNDLKGKIPAIIDGGACIVGVESTVVCFEGEKVKILRPGFITGEDMVNAGFEVLYARGITEKLDDNEKALSPGMKYKHYAPKAEITLVDSNANGFVSFALENKSCDTYFLVSDKYKEKLSENNIDNIISYGSDEKEMAKELFDKLRLLDDVGAKKVYAEIPPKSGVGLAVYNRLIRAAAFRVLAL